MTPQERKVLEMALEALGTMDVFNPNRMEAIIAIKEALAQPEIEYQERILRLECALKKVNDQAEHFEREWYLRGDEIERLKAQPEQEPVAWEYKTLYIPNPQFDDGMRVTNDLRVAQVNAEPETIKPLVYTTPPQRKPMTEWQPIETAPKDKQLLLATEFDGPNDWRIKIGYFSSEVGAWRVWGASWIPTRWAHLPESPAIEAAHGIKGDA